MVYGLIPKVQSESLKLNEIIDNDKEKEPLSLLGKKGSFQMIWKK